MDNKNQPSHTKLDQVATIIRPSEWILSLIFLLIVFLVLIWGIFGELSHKVEVLGVIDLKDSHSVSIDAPASGFTGPIYIKKGDLVESGTPLMEVISVKKGSTQREGQKASLQSHKILSPMKSRVQNILTDTGKHLFKKDTLLQLQTPGSQPKVNLYFSAQTYKQIQVGQEVLVTLSHARKVKALSGQIHEISKVPVDREKALLPKDLLPPPPIYRGTVLFNEIFPPQINEDGFTWEVSKEDHTPVSAGHLVRTSILIKKQRPILMLLPFLFSNESQ